MTEYNKLKSMLLDIQSKGLSREEESYSNGMEQKRALVDAMFKYLDLNGDGRLGSEELAQVGMGRSENWITTGSLDNLGGVNAMPRLTSSNRAKQHNGCPDTAFKGRPWTKILLRKYCVCNNKRL